MISSTNRIEKHVMLKAPRERVWRALSDARTFGTWFRMSFDAEFAEGKHVVGTLLGESKYAGMSLDFFIDRIEPMDVFSYRWHPFAIERGVDYSHEPLTTVTFTLADAPGGTSLTIVESGFDALPEMRRIDAFESNDEGWLEQTRRLEAFLTQSAA